MGGQNLPVGFFVLDVSQLEEFALRADVLLGAFISAHPDRLPSTVNVLEMVGWAKRESHRQTRSDSAETTLVREEFLELFPSRSDAIAFENAALSVGDEFLPEVARQVRDREAEDVPVSYWHWLIDQVRQSGAPAPTRKGKEYKRDK